MSSRLWFRVWAETAFGWKTLSYLPIFFPLCPWNSARKPIRTHIHTHTHTQRNCRDWTGVLVGFTPSEGLTSSNLAPLFTTAPYMVGGNAKRMTGIFTDSLVCVCVCVRELVRTRRRETPPSGQQSTSMFTSSCYTPLMFSPFVVLWGYVDGCVCVGVCARRCVCVCEWQNQVHICHSVCVCA